MPKSKRDKDVSLTKVKKKTKAAKVTLVEEIQKCLDAYETMILISVENLRSSSMVAVCQHFKTDSRFFFGRNNVMALALGRDPETEHRDGLHRVARLMRGQCGLMFSHQPPDQLLQYFASLSIRDYARAGIVAEETVELAAGQLEHAEDTIGGWCSFAMEPQLRKLGLPTQLQKGRVHVTTDFTVCRLGEPLSSESAKLLKLMGRKLSSFRVAVLATVVFDSGSSHPRIKIYTAKKQQQELEQEENKKRGGKVTRLNKANRLKKNKKSI